MEAGLGVLGYTPDVFWNLSLPEWIAAQRGYVRKCGGDADEAGFEPVLMDELQRLIETYG